MAGPLTLSALAERFALDSAQVAALEAYVELLSGWKRANVTGLRSRAEIVETLLGDSLAMLDVSFVRERAGAGWLDLGAGAGIPGIPLAVALPSVELTLLEAAARKCDFLEAAADAAGIAGLKELGVKVIYNITDAQNVPAAWNGNVGRITLEQIKAEVPDLLHSHFYISGPDAMVDGFKSSLNQLGVHAAQIKLDYFAGF